MLDRLIDFILSLIADVLPCLIIPVYNKALLLRAGKTYKVLDPGFHWKIPFLDKAEEHTVVTTTLSIKVQSCITSDGRQIAAKVIVKYSIDDIKKYVENISDAVDALSDLTQAKVMIIINARTFNECIDAESLSNILSIKVRADVKKYGINVEQTTFTDLVETPSYRLFMDGIFYET